MISHLAYAEGPAAAGGVGVAVPVAAGASAAGSTPAASAGPTSGATLGAVSAAPAAALGSAAPATLVAPAAPAASGTPPAGNSALGTAPNLTMPGTMPLGSAPLPTYMPTAAGEKKASEFLTGKKASPPSETKHSAAEGTAKESVESLGATEATEPADKAAATGKPEKAGRAEKTEKPELSAEEKFMSSEGNSTMQPQPFQVGELTLFGYNFFDQTASPFEPVVDVPVGPDYILGPGDTMVLTVWGSLDANLPLEVSRSGDITLPKVGPLRVWGVPFGKVPELILEALGKTFKDVYIDVSMGKLRRMKVYVVGEVTAPGSYDISSMATVINALAAAKGPSKQGTLRAIQVLRE